MTTDERDQTVLKIGRFNNLKDMQENLEAAIERFATMQTSPNDKLGEIGFIPLRCGATVINNPEITYGQFRNALLPVLKENLRSVIAEMESL